MKVHYMCVPESEHSKQETWIFFSKYRSSILYPNECIWFVPNTEEEDDECNVPMADYYNETIPST